MKQKVCVLGLGYIGLPTACLMASNSLDVCGVDIDEQVLLDIKDCKVDLNEPNLASLLKRCLNKRNFNLCKTPIEADYFLICTPTPVKILKNKIEPDLSFVYRAIDNISKFLKNEDTIIIESTVPIGTTEKILNYVIEIRPDLTKIFIGYCPERVLPGNILFELKNNTRIVGGVDPISTKRIADLYNKFVSGDILKTTSKVAEICKLAENAYRDVNIGFANELSLICKDKKINISEVISLTNHHPRVEILKPGIGVGGHCIPVDPWFLISDNYNKSSIMQAARKVNTAKTNHIFEDVQKKIIFFLKKNKRLPLFSFLGVSYKENSGDIRGAPALQIIKKIYEKYKNFYIVDPYVDLVLGSKTQKLNIALKESDIIFMLVNHSGFKDVEKKIKKSSIFIDYTFS